MNTLRKITRLTVLALLAASVTGCCVYPFEDGRGGRRGHGGRHLDAPAYPGR